MTKGFTNPENKTSKELTSARYKQKVYGQYTYAGWHDDFMNSGAHYQMNFTEYKKMRRNRKKYDAWLKKMSE